MAVFIDTLLPVATAPTPAGNYADSRRRTFLGWFENAQYGIQIRAGGAATSGKGGFPYQYTSFIRYELTVPSYASIDKAKIRIQANNSKSTPDPISFGVLEKDGRWDPVAGVSIHTNQKTVPYFKVKGDSGTIAVQGNNGGQGTKFLTQNITDFYRQAFGASVKVKTAVTNLESIEAEIERTGSSSGLMRLDIYNTVSPTDPTPTGSVIASSDVVDKLTIPTLSAGTYTPFLFSGGDQITLSVNQRFAFKLVDPDDTPNGPTGVNWALDSGYDDESGLNPNSSIDSDNHTVIWSSIPVNGFNPNAYLTHQEYPSPSPKDSKALNLGVLFQDVRDQFDIPDISAEAFQEWGTSGYAADGVFPLHTRISAWVGEPGYDPTGHPIAFSFEAFVNKPLYILSFRQAPQLIIEYSFDPPVAPTDPVPADEAVEVPITQVLSWTGGARTESYDVYFGIDPSPDAGEFIGNQPGSSYDPGLLLKGITYYWRIDAVNDAGTTTGTVWSFSTPSLSYAEDGGDVVQIIVEVGGDVTQSLLEVGGDTFLTIVEDGGDITQYIAEDGGDVTQYITEDGGDVSNGEP